jgi:hypothetical protein
VLLPKGYQHSLLLRCCCFVCCCLCCPVAAHSGVGSAQPWASPHSSSKGPCAGSTAPPAAAHHPITSGTNNTTHCAGTQQAVDALQQLAQDMSLQAALAIGAVPGDNCDIMLRSSICKPSDVLHVRPGSLQLAVVAHLHTAPCPWDVQGFGLSF